MATAVVFALVSRSALANADACVRVPTMLLFQVAIKKMKKKFYTWEECMQLREVKVSPRVARSWCASLQR